MTGESITADFQVQIGSLLLGPGTPYEITKAVGFLDLPAVRADDPERPRQHGTFTGPDYTGPRVFELELDIVATSSTTFTDAVTAFLAVTVPQPGTVDLAWRLPGRGVLSSAVKVRKSTIGVDRGYQLGIAETVALQLLAPDPVAYAGVLTAVTGLPFWSAGLVWPLAFPLDFGAAGTLGRVTLTNPGTADTAPVLAVTGPLDVGFLVTVVETGQTLRFEQPVAGTSTVTLDCGTGHAVLDGGAYRDDALTVADWFVVPAGTSRTVQLATLGAYDAAAAMSATWAPAYW